MIKDYPHEAELIELKYSSWEKYKQIQDRMLINKMFTPSECSIC